MSSEERRAGEEARLVAEFGRAMREYRRALLSAPGAASAVLERWRELRARGATTRRLAEGYGREGADQSLHVDRCLSEAERLLARRESTLGACGPAAVRELDRGVTGWLLEADLSLQLLRTIEAELASPPGALLRARRRVSRLRNRIAVAHLGLVASLAPRFRHLGVPLADLVQEGALGLLRAVECYDPARGPLGAYAVWWIRHGMVRAVQNHGRTVRVPTHRHAEHRALRKAERAALRAGGRPPTRDELASALALRVEDVDTLETLFTEPVALDDAPDEGTRHLPAPIELASHGGGDAEDAVARHDEICSVQAWLERLPTREREILRLRFGLGGHLPLPLREVGARLGLSGERVRQLEKAALERLRRNFDAELRRALRPGA